MTDKSSLILDLTKAYNDHRCKDYKESIKRVLDILELQNGEYIKKEDVLVYLEKWKIGHIEDKEHYPINYGTLLDMMFFIRHLSTYSIPETAKPEEGAELIDRRQIKWYGCDHEGHIKGINCDTADCSKCFYATVEHDEVTSLPVYRIPDSADIEKIRAEIIQDVQNGVIQITKGSDRLFEIIDKYIGR